MRAGRLDKRVSLERIDPGEDDHGEPLETWSTLAVRWASIEPLNGREYLAKSVENSEVTTRIRLRYDSVSSTLTSADRINHNGTIYSIDGPPINPRMQNAELVLMCVLNDRLN